MKIVNLCPVCGGSGKFLMQKCGSCNGEGGVLLKFNKSIGNAIEQIIAKLSEQEVAAYNLYKNGYSKENIAKNMDIAPAKVALLLCQIEKKLN